MFRNTYQSGFISILYAGGSKPLNIWGQVVRNGHIRRVSDEDVQTLALEVMGTNVATTYILCPADRKNVLGIRLPFFVMIVKNMKKYFTFEIQILDDKNMSRRFRVSNYQSTTRVRPFSTSLPIGLTGGWNQIQFNLADFTRRAYGSSYLETLRVQIHANVRIRRIYFSDRLYAEDEMPAEFKLYVPITTKKEKGKAKDVKVMEDKSTGKDFRTKSKEFSEQIVEEKIPPADAVPSGALPSPTETPHPEEVTAEPENVPQASTATSLQAEESERGEMMAEEAFEDEGMEAEQQLEQAESIMEEESLAEQEMEFFEFTEELPSAATLTMDNPENSPVAVESEASPETVEAAEMDEPLPSEKLEVAGE